jgi:septal ring factor EnvC (AmiA/AmiB activator)
MKKNFENILIFLSKNFNKIGITLLILFGLYWIIFILTPSIKMSSVAVEEIKKLEEEIGTIKLEQNILYTEIQQYEEKIEGLDENITKINTTQNKIAGQYGEKINAARSYDYQQLVSFLSERYSDPGVH